MTWCRKLLHAMTQHLKISLLLGGRPWPAASSAKGAQAVWPPGTPTAHTLVVPCRMLSCQKERDLASGLRLH